MCGATATVRKFKVKFPRLTESTIRPWVKKYKEMIKAKSSRFVNFKICEKRGRLSLLDEELGRKLRAMVITLRKAGFVINVHVIRGILIGLIRSNSTQFGQYCDFVLTRSWLRSLYQRMKFSRRAVTTSRPVVTKSLWIEVRSQFLHDISQEVLEYGIPDELIININQTPSKFVPTENITMNSKGEKHVSRTSGNDKRYITATLCESLDGTMLPFQLIYKGKTERSLPSYDFPEGFSLSFNEKHWGNEIETIQLIDEILLPYIEKVKKEHNLPDYQKSLLIWDAFRAQSTATVMGKVSSHDIQTVLVPANMTHLLQPLDLTTNASFKKLEKRSFSEYFP